MFRKSTFLGMAAVLLALTLTSEAMAWGAYHVGYTHYGPSGFQHWGRTAAAGPYGAHYGGSSFGRVGGYGYGEHYGAGYHYGDAYRYSPSLYGGYHYGGFRTDDLYGGYRAGYYRRW